MNRELEPADLLPAIQSVAGALAVEVVLAKAAQAAAERELAELRALRAEPAPAGDTEPGEWRPKVPAGDWRNGAGEPATTPLEAP